MAAKPMNLDLIQEMVTNYKTKQYLSIVTNTINPMSFDAQSVCFTLDALKSFIQNIEYQVAQHPDHPMTGLGIRFYYSAYPKYDVWDETGYEDLAGLNSQYSKLHTLIAIPTAQINGVCSDFDPADIKTYNGDKPTSGPGTAIMAENHGELNPPSAAGLWF